MFYRAASMKGGLNHERNVCPSVCLPNAWIVKKTKETCVHILIPHERTFILVFRHEEWWMVDDPLYLQFWASVQTKPIFNRYSLVAPQP